MKKWYMVLILELSILMWLGDYEGYIVISFLWVILHEFAHMIVASKFGCKFNNVNISIFGAKVELSDIDELTERKKMILYLAGPFFNIFMAVVMCYLYGYFKYQIIEDSIKVNFFLGAFNLLPAYPLDGSRYVKYYYQRSYYIKDQRKLQKSLALLFQEHYF